jgi:Ca-activated chloride channel family protein
MDVDARIVGLDAVVNLRQSFHNPTRHVAEVTYVFPLPARAAVTSFAATLGGRRILGTLRERQVAREIYEEAIAFGHRAGIVEEERPEVFTARVGNLAPGEQATVELTLVHRLVVEDAEATFRFPLVVAPRYVSGSPIAGRPVGDGAGLDTDAVPDASRVTPPTLLSGCPCPVALSMAVVVDPSGLHLSDLRCSLHSLAEGAPAPGSAISEPVRVELLTGSPLDRDFLLRMRLAADDLDTCAVLVPDNFDDSGSRPRLEGDGTFLVTIVPPLPAEDDERAESPTDVVVVLDRSGSMDGWKIVAARRAAGRIVDALATTDRLGVLAFNNGIECFQPSGTESSGLDLHPATDANRYHAVEFLARLEAGGGTELHGALAAALAAAAGSGRPTVVVLVTDGQVADEDRLVAAAEGAGAHVRIHCVGIDHAVNGGLLERLARVGHGHCELVATENRLDEVLVALNRRIKSPVLSDLSVSGDGLDIVPGTLTPAGTVDAFAGVPVEITGRYRGSGSIVVRASLGDGGTLAHRLEPRRSNEPALVAIWGRSRIRDLEDAYAAHSDESLAATLVTTSLATGVLCRHTAFVAVDEQGRVPIEGSTVRMMQPVPSPSGWAGAAPSAGLILQPHRASASTRSMSPPGVQAMPARRTAPLASRAASGGQPAVPNPSSDPEYSATPDQAVPFSWPPSSDTVITLRRAAERLTHGTLGDLARLELAGQLLQLLVARVRAGEAGDNLDRTLRAFIVALLTHDRDSSARLADGVLAVLGPLGETDPRPKQFWRRRPTTPGG